MLPVIEKLDKRKYMSRIDDYKRLETILNLIKDYVIKKDIKQNSSYEESFGLLALYPFFRERERYKNL